MNRRLRQARQLVALLGLLVAVQARAISPEIPPEDFLRESWMQAQGMHENSVLSLARTPDGYLWIADEAGLERFDGVRFKLFEKERLGKDTSAFESLAVGSSGQLWIVTRGGQLLEFSPEKGVLQDLSLWSFGKAAGANHSWVSVDPSGRVWVRWGTSGLLTLDKDGLHPFRLAAGSPVPNASVVLQRRDGTLLFGTNTGVRRVHQGRLIPWEQASACVGPVQQLFEDHMDRIWVALENGNLCRIEKKGFRLFDGQHELPGGRLGPIAEDSSGAIWLPSSRDLVRIVGEKVQPCHLDLRANGATSVLEDPEGSLWVGTTVGGLVRLRDSAVVTLGPEVGATSLTTAIQEGANGELWFGSGDGRIVRWKDKPLQVFGPDQGLPGAGILALARAPDGTLWAGTEDGLWVLKDGRFERTWSTLLPRGTGVSRLLLQRNGMLWAGSSERLYRIEGSSATPIGDPKDGALLDLHESEAGDVWGSTHQGLFIARAGQTTLEQVRDQAGQPVPSTARFTLDGKTVWLFTRDHRLGRLRHKQLDWIGVSNGLPDVRPQAIIVGPEHDFWITSNSGLFRAQLDDLNAVFDGRSSHVDFTSFDLEDGLRSLEFDYGVPNAIVDSAGRLWFANLAGAVRSAAGRFRANSVPPPVLIEGVQITGAHHVREYDPVASLTVPPGAQQLAIDYAGLSFMEPDRVHFEYQLDGVDEQPVSAGTRRTAYYTGLPPGTHHFRVWAFNNDGVRSQKDATLELIVLPRWYQTHWFQALCGLSVLGLFVLIYNLRVRRLKAQRRELENLVRERTADLEREKAKSESLLLNVLPPPIAERLKTGELTIADSFDEVSILFADIAGFTTLSAHSKPENIVGLLNEIFSRFDLIAERHGVEKIKTIGDAYMVVAGVPVPRPDHASVLALVALEMLEALTHFNQQRGVSLAIRVGINSGPVVAGVIGRRKFSYDLWGDTVNTASRMESHGVVGRIHITEATRSRLGPDFVLEDRGEIHVKGKGEMRTFLIVSRRAAAQVA